MVGESVMLLKVGDIVEVIKNNKYNYAKIICVDYLRCKVKVSYDSSNKISNWKYFSEVKIMNQKDEMNNMLNVNSEGLKVIKFIGNSMHPIVSQLNQFFNSNNVNVIKIEHLVDECYVYYKEFKS